MTKMKKKITKPRDWAIVHLLKKHNSGEHGTRKKRPKEKQELNRQLREDNLEDI